jgi:wobble nucleotide-excising tRNase
MKHSKPVNLYKPSTGNNKSLVRILSAIIICLVTFVFHQQKDTSPNHLIEKIESNEEQLSRQAELTEKIKAELTASITEYKNTVKILEQRLKESHDERDAAESSKKDLQTKLRGANGKEKENNGDEKEIESMKKSIDAVSTQIDHLKAEMQKSAKIDALKKFGPGPHRVKFELDFHPDEIPAGDATSFVIEMAPLDLVSFSCLLAYLVNLSILFCSRNDQLSICKY